MDDFAQKPEEKGAGISQSAQIGSVERHKLTQAQLDAIVADHKRWLDSGGESGQQADLHHTDLRQVNLMGLNLRKAILAEADLRDANLTGADFQKADLQSARLSKVNFSLANLHAANLQKADLSEVEGLQNANLRYVDLDGATGLLGTEFAGNDLTGAKLPKTIGDFKSLKTIEEASQNASKNFFAMILGCVYSWLTIATTTDVKLLTNTTSSPLPIIGTQIPIAYFYNTAPLILIGLYFYLHLYLQRVWKELALLPAKFPDGKQLNEHVYPWLLSGLVRRQFELLKKERSYIDRLEEWVSIFLAWWTVPFTLIGFWIRYLPRHEWTGTQLHIFLLFASFAAAAIFYRAAVKTLCGKALGASSSKSAPRYEKYCFAAGLGLIGVLLLVLSYGAISGIRIKGKDFHKQVSNYYNVKILVPLFFEEFGFSTFADFRESSVSTKPDNYWEIKAEERLKSVRGAFLKQKNLQYADMFQAFLAKSNLRNANLHGARLRQADLQQSDLRGADLGEAFLGGADFRNAILRETNFYQANLGEANLQNADLEEAVLREAHFGEADLETPERGIAHLREANFRKADLRQAGGLIVSQICEARTLHEAKLDGHLKQQVEEKCPRLLDDPDGQPADK